MQAKPKCPYCGFEGEFKLHKTWKFRFYNVDEVGVPKVRRNIQPLSRCKPKRQSIRVCYQGKAKNSHQEETCRGNTKPNTTNLNPKQINLNSLHT
jgi:ribosomal protein L40E